MNRLLTAFIILMSIHASGQDRIDLLYGATAESMMVVVAGGSYEMGSMTGTKDERPPHMVTINSFGIAKYEVTQSVWFEVMGDTPSLHKNCMECPVENVSSERIDTFIFRLNQRVNRHYRLPTEAEWEYAAMGGVRSKKLRYSGSDTLDNVAWNKLNSGGTTHIVGTKHPNELGLYDMSGNVWELCQDYYSAGFYSKSREWNPVNKDKTQLRVVRGGSWRSGDERCYSKARNRNIHDHRIGNNGFRLVVDLKN